MAVNSYKQDELQRDVPKRVTLARLYRYLFAYKKRNIRGFVYYGSDRGGGSPESPDH